MASTGELEVGVDPLSQGGVVVHVDGELDLATVEKLESALATTDPGAPLVIDLTACTVLDSSAVRVLVTTARSAEAAGGSVSLVTSDPGLLRILEIAAIDTMLPVHPTLDAAL
ncbi:MAG TPA: STAS domain-containing protein [Gaiellaceae bacterium]|nr:STAS domain-containing protein [Gaiellaceae bacterium]